MQSRVQGHQVPDTWHVAHRPIERVATHVGAVQTYRGRSPSFERDPTDPILTQSQELLLNLMDSCKWPLSSSQLHFQRSALDSVSCKAQTCKQKERIILVEPAIRVPSRLKVGRTKVYGTAQAMCAEISGRRSTTDWAQQASFKLKLLLSGTHHPTFA